MLVNILHNTHSSDLQHVIAPPMLYDLPDEILIQILGCLDINDILAFQTVCFCPLFSARIYERSDSDISKESFAYHRAHCLDKRVTATCSSTRISIPNLPHRTALRSAVDACNKACRSTGKEVVVSPMERTVSDFVTDCCW
jgi:hypothetical protein